MSEGRGECMSQRGECGRGVREGSIRVGGGMDISRSRCYGRYGLIALIYGIIYEFASQRTKAKFIYND